MPAGDSQFLVMSAIQGAKVPPRVLPLLTAALKTAHFEQRLGHLLLLRERWEDVAKVRVTTEDAYDLLVALLVFVNKTDPGEGSTAAQVNHASSAAYEAFCVLHKIFTAQHAHSRTFTQAIQKVMSELKCTDEQFYARPKPAGAVENYSSLKRELMDTQNSVRADRRKEQQMAAELLLHDLAELKEKTAETAEIAPLHAIEREVAAFLTEKPAGSEEVAVFLKSVDFQPFAERVDKYTERIEELLKQLAAEKEAEKEMQPTNTPPNEEDIPLSPRNTKPQVELPVSGELGACFPAVLTPEDLYFDKWLRDDTTRAFATQLLKTWDFSGINVRYMLSSPAVHIYLPTLYSRREKVYRDFICCPQRPKGSARWGPVSSIHIKTNIKKKSDIMYRFLIEGYNYGTNGIIHCDIAGYSHRKWDRIGKGAMEDAGWPEGWDTDLSYSYMNGCTVDQYYSSDGFVVIRLQSRSFFCIGFGVSAWLVVQEFGSGYQLSASIHHSDAEL